MTTSTIKVLKDISSQSCIKIDLLEKNFTGCPYNSPWILDDSRFFDIWSHSMIEGETHFQATDAEDFQLHHHRGLFSYSSSF
jgi:hypothetical protein